MYLKHIRVEGYRASAATAISCEFGGRFSLILGANGSGKTTINEAIILAHPRSFPHLGSIDATALGDPPRTVVVQYEFESDESYEGAFGKRLKQRGFGAPKWSRLLERSLGYVRAGRITEDVSGCDCIRLVHLPALRNPVDDLSRRDARILLELLRAEERRHPETGGLHSLRGQAKGMLESLVEHSLVSNVEKRIADNLRTISGGVQEHHAFIGTQTVDDTYLARVFEMLVALLPNRSIAQRLQVSSLGYVNLLHIAVTLAGIPDVGNVSFPEGLRDDDDTEKSRDSRLTGEESRINAARQRLEKAQEASNADADSFYPELFHATVLIEEPEAHLHPQLQFGLIRYLRRLVAERHDIQIIVTTHSADLAAACDPEELIIVRKDRENCTHSRRVASLPLPDGDKAKLLQQTRLHLDATRSAAFFADRVLVVEGVTDASILRLLGRAWAGDDEARVAFVDSLAILPVGHKVGQWPIRLLATPGYELATRVAALADTDNRGAPLPEPNPPAWHKLLDSGSARFFWSQPTLEPSLVDGNEMVIREALCAISGNDTPVEITRTTVDAYFQDHSGKKGEFALELVSLFDARLREGKEVVVPQNIGNMFAWLFTGDDNVEAS